MFVDTWDEEKARENLLMAGTKDEGGGEYLFTSLNIEMVPNGLGKGTLAASQDQLAIEIQ
ncbi:MAG: hypothetical protein Q9M91_07290 [Candidatus Dojkabacteria bacterium]|nr:hypothetical protein [Candidatus Dojkabacteria bacterium]MDQ7021592.1 hypothetical protein [Candidatus Dojkabacteria bacterium]